MPERPLYVILAGSQDKAREFARSQGLKPSQYVAPGWASSLIGFCPTHIVTLESFLSRPGGWRRAVTETLRLAATKSPRRPISIFVRGR